MAVNILTNGQTVTLSANSDEFFATGEGRIRVFNTGTGQATNVEVVVTVPAGITINGDTPTAGTFAVDTWSLATLDPCSTPECNGEEEFLDLSFLITDDSLQPFTLTYTVTHDDSPDDVSADNAGERTISGISCSAFVDCTEASITDTNFFTDNLTLTDPTRTHDLGANDVAINGVAGSSWFFSLTDAGTTATTSYELTATPTGAPTRTIREASRILGGSGRSYQRFIQPGYEQKLITGTVSGLSFNETIDQSIPSYVFQFNNSGTSIDYTHQITTSLFSESLSHNGATWLRTVSDSGITVDFIGSDPNDFSVDYITVGGRIFQSEHNSGGVVLFNMDALNDMLVFDAGIYRLTTAPSDDAAPDYIITRDTATGNLGKITPADLVAFAGSKEVNIPYYGDGTDVVSTAALAAIDVPAGVTIPASMNTWSLSAGVATVHTLGATSGAETIEVQIVRRRAGVNTNMFATPITLTDLDYFATNGVLGAAGDIEVLTGDHLSVVVSQTFDTTEALGLTIALTFTA